MRNQIFLSTVDSCIFYFHVPFVEFLKNIGYEVEVACSNAGFTNGIERGGFRVYNFLFNRKPFNLIDIEFFMLLKLMRRQTFVKVNTHLLIESFVVKLFRRLWVLNVIFIIFVRYMSNCTNISAILLVLIGRLIN